MIITCEECGTRFNLNEELIKPQGSKVRCSKCKAVFVAHPSVHPEVTSATDAAAMGEGMSGTELPAEGLEDTVSPSVEAVDPFASPELGEDDLRFDVPGQPSFSPVGVSVETDLETPDGLDLSDLDQMFADEEETIGGEAGADVEEAAEELDLSELEQMLESEEPHFEKEDAAAAVDGLEFDSGDLSAVDEPIAAAAGDELPGGTEELDLSELEKVLESEEVPTEVEDDANAFEDLQLVLGDADSGEEPVLEAVHGEPVEGTEELDLSELEKLLESEETSAELGDAVAGLEDFELELGDAPEGGIETVGTAAESEGKLDLSEIEKMLETEGEAADTFEEAVELEDMELDLDLPEDSLEEKVEEHVAAATEADDFELADLEDVFETKTPEAQEDTFETEDLDLDFDIDGLDEAESADSAHGLSERAPEVEPREEDFAVADPAMAATEAHVETESEPMTAMAAASPMIAPKKRMNAPLWVLLILLILGGGAFGAYTVLNRMGIEVPFARQLANLDIELPFIGRLTKPKIQDPGNLKIKTFEISSRFVTNAKDGKLFVISGQVKNEYPESREAISITGKLYTKGKIEARSETVFCGNVLSDTELADLGVAAIMQRLAQPLGAGDANRVVKTGASLPFMVIFGNLPDDLEEFTLEVAGSSAVQ